MLTLAGVSRFRAHRVAGTVTPNQDTSAFSEYGDRADNSFQDWSYKK
jgi:hypothetical protein